MYTVSGVQKICDALSENPSWSIAHLISFFNLIEHIGNPKCLDLIDYPDHQNNMTPLQLAIKATNFEMVKSLLPLCRMDHLDTNSNSVYHYASITTKEMINVSTDSDRQFFFSAFLSLNKSINFTGFSSQKCSKFKSL